jgi:hypothetical protein
VVNVTVKRRDQTRHVWVGETNESEPLITHRNSFEVASKLGTCFLPRISMAGTCLLAMWCPVYRWRDSNPGLGAELGNSLCDSKGKLYKWSP